MGQSIGSEAVLVFKRFGNVSVVAAKWNWAFADTDVFLKSLLVVKRALILAVSVVPHFLEVCVI